MKILITGGTGLIGKALIRKLLDAGHDVNVLSRSGKHVPGAKVFRWNLDEQWIEDGAFEGVQAIVHLAGENISAGRWTKKFKKIIVESRTKSVELIGKYLRANEQRPGAFISGSGIGYYGADTGEDIMAETSKAGNDFIASCTVQWEKASKKLAKENNLRLVKIRIGIVLSRDGGAFPKLVQPVRMGLGASLGSGKQWMSWIHIDDLAELFYQAVINEKMTGIYNGVAPNPVTNGKFTREVAARLGKKIWLPAVPSFLLRLVLGEMSSVVTGSSYVRSRRIEKEGILPFRFKQLDQALTDLLP